MRNFGNPDPKVGSDKVYDEKGFPVSLSDPHRRSLIVTKKTQAPRRRNWVEEIIGICVDLTVSETHKRPRIMTSLIDYGSPLVFEFPVLLIVDLLSWQSFFFFFRTFDLLSIVDSIFIILSLELLNYIIPYLCLYLTIPRSMTSFFSLLEKVFRCSLLFFILSFPLTRQIFPSRL